MVPKTVYRTNVGVFKHEPGNGYSIIGHTNISQFKVYIH